MTAENLLIRLEMLEQRVTALETMPARIDALSVQIQQLRQETRDGLSALREEIRAGDEETRRILREEIRAGDEETRRILREEIRAGDEETRRSLREEIQGLRTHMLVLHEDLVERIKRLGEAWSSSRPSGSKNGGDAPPRKRRPGRG